MNTAKIEMSRQNRLIASGIPGIVFPSVVLWRRFGRAAMRLQPCCSALRADGDNREVKRNMSPLRGWRLYFAF